MNLFVDSKNHLDIYLNEDCNLRCSHCFVGNKLNNKTNMEWDNYLRIIKKARTQGASKLSLLGGEPTIYPKIIEAVKEAFILGYKSVKLVSNETKPLTKFLLNYDYHIKPLIVLSIDGIEDVHEKIRGKNSFLKLKENIILASSLKFNLAGITSLSHDNYENINSIIEFSEKNNFKYLNVHRVNPIGFAESTKPINATKWMNIKEQIIESSIGKDIKINFDLNFIKKSTMNNNTKSCIVSDESGGNIMIYPDKKIFKCSLFSNFDLSSYEFFKDDFLPSKNQISENSICNSNEHCPGSIFIGDTEKKSDYVKICIYKKEIIQNGLNVCE